MPLSRIALALATLLLLAAAPAKPRPATPQPGMTEPGTPQPGMTQPGIPVTLQSQPGTPADAVARKLVADDLAAARSRGDTPLLLIGSANLGGAQPALFVQLQSPQECGSAGCSTSVYAFERRGWTRVLDGITGRLTVTNKRTKGRADLFSDDERYVWTGSAYRGTRPAPAVDLRPRRPKH